MVYYLYVYEYMTAAEANESMTSCAMSIITVTMRTNNNKRTLVVLLSSLDSIPFTMQLW